MSLLNVEHSAVIHGGGCSSDFLWRYIILLASISIVLITVATEVDEYLEFPFCLPCWKFCLSVPNLRSEIPGFSSRFSKSSRGWNDFRLFALKCICTLGSLQITVMGFWMRPKYYVLCVGNKDSRTLLVREGLCPDGLTKISLCLQIWHVCQFSIQPIPSTLRWVYPWSGADPGGCTGAVITPLWFLLHSNF